MSRRPWMLDIQTLNYYSVVLINLWKCLTMKPFYFTAISYQLSTLIWFYCFIESSLNSITIKKPSVSRKENHQIPCQPKKHFDNKHNSEYWSRFSTFYGVIVDIYNMNIWTLSPMAPGTIRIAQAILWWIKTWKKKRRNKQNKWKKILGCFFPIHR